MKLPRAQYAHPAGESPGYDQLLLCSRCATCLPECPSYSATMLETRSPRGRLQLVRAVEEGKLPVTAGVREALSTCLDCRACESACPNGLHPGQTTARVRAEWQNGMPFSRFVKRLILGPGLSHPRLLEVGFGAARLAYQRTGLQHLIRHSGALKALPRLQRMDGYLPRIPTRSVRRSLPEVVPAEKGTARGRVGFFLGCAMNTIFADVTRASIRVLTRLGYEVVVPRGVFCCGAPQVSLGERDLAKAMARHNMACFEGLDIIVTDCAACGAELKHYDTLLEDEMASSFCSRVRDFAEFVEPLIAEGAGKADVGSVTYHAPCHLAHAQGVCAQPIALLKRLCTDYRALPEHDRCCGSAGMYWMLHPDISDDALARKLVNIRATGAATVVTANPGCLLQLLMGREEQDSWRVVHIAELVEEALWPRNQ